jgi:hypothetical protein
MWELRTLREIVLNIFPFCPYAPKFYLKKLSITQVFEQMLKIWRPFHALQPYFHEKEVNYEYSREDILFRYFFHIVLIERRTQIKSVGFRNICQYYTTVFPFIYNSCKTRIANEL